MYTNKNNLNSVYTLYNQIIIMYIAFIIDLHYYLQIL